MVVLQLSLACDIKGATMDETMASMALAMFPICGAYAPKQHQHS